MTNAVVPIASEFDEDQRLGPSILMIRIGLCLLALWAIFVLIVFETRRHVWAEAGMAAGNLATLVESAITREFEVYDLSIQAASEASLDPSLLALPVAIRRQFVFDRSSNASKRGRVLVVDASGHVIQSSHNGDPVGIDVSDRDYFRALRDGLGNGLYVSGPFLSRITRQLSIALARRRPEVDGRFNGIVVGTLQLDFFSSLFNAVRLVPGSSITLIKADGTIMTRVPYASEYVGRMARGATLEAIATGAAAGSFRRLSVTDGVDRLFSFRRIGTLPLFVNVGLSTHEIFATWRWEMAVIGLGFALLSAIIVALGLTLAAEFLRRGMAERQLADLACTDYLTLVANRRRFDEALAIEWQRAVRTASPLSLLMVDCDFFKSFNDTYGHPAGDRVLRSIATALKSCVERPGSLVARYGGEEFAVLLSATEAAGALSTATALRDAVDALDLAHAITPTGRLTVSIGLACIVPTASQDSSMLVEAADTALYTAKRDGRDRIVNFDQAFADIDIRHVA